jgi:hypothetical protein
MMTQKSFCLLAIQFGHQLAIPLFISFLSKSLTDRVGENSFGIDSEFTRATKENHRFAHWQSFCWQK